MSKICNQDECLFDLNTEYFRYTVEEVSPFKFIATYWDKEMELEFDRTVREFETSGGAFQECLEMIRVNEYVNSGAVV